MESHPFRKRGIKNFSKEFAERIIRQKRKNFNYRIEMKGQRVSCLVMVPRLRHLLSRYLITKLLGEKNI